jgi:hypothetical protein
MSVKSRPTDETRYGLGLALAARGKRHSYYVDSVNGLDANDGRSPAKARQTIAGLVALGNVLSGASGTISSGWRGSSAAAGRQ